MGLVVSNSFEEQYMQRLPLYQLLFLSLMNSILNHNFIDFPWSTHLTNTLAQETDSIIVQHLCSVIFQNGLRILNVIIDGAADYINLS